MDMSKVFHGILWILGADHRFFCGQLCIWNGKDKAIFSHGSGNEPDYELSFRHGSSDREFPFLFFIKDHHFPGLYRDFGRHGILPDFVCFFSKQEADGKEKKRHLTGIEAMLMAVVLSLDSLAVGLGTGLVPGRGGMLLAAGSFAGGILMMEAGWKLGNAFCISSEKGFILA